MREGDKLSIKERARFFRKTLKLPWTKEFTAEKDVATRINELFQKRHQIVHADTETHVSDGDIKAARELFISIPNACCDAARKLYPTQFEDTGK